MARAWHDGKAAVAMGCAYLAACSATILFTRFDGGIAFLWIANALLTARLTTLPARQWAPSIAACFIANVVATVMIGLGPAMALPLAAVNMAESIIGAALLRRFIGQRAAIDSHRWLVVFVLVVGVTAPLLGALGAASARALILDGPFAETALHWYSGHALGTLAFMPIALLVLHGETRQLITRNGRAGTIEQVALIALVALVSTIAFAQNGLPLLFLPLLPVVLATFRGGALSTAASVVVLAVVGGGLTVYGSGPIAMIDAPLGARMQFLQLYLACTMLTVLPANAELERRAELFRRLRESEARYRLVTENSTDIVLNIDREGRLRFVSQSIRQIGGHEPEAVIGKPMAALLHPDDAARAAESLRRTIEDPASFTVGEYRGFGEANDVRWFETHSRAVTDDDGNVTGVVSAIRDITHRKAHEERLARAALTDPLTGLLNRRAFDEELASRIGSGNGGCVAIFDLDHFKQINDRYGHAAGDEVLRRFATIARSSAREQDLVARLGGEEFAVILPDATIEQARLVCDRLRTAVADTRLRVDGQIISVTVSGGVSPYTAGQSVDTALHAADVALYGAKTAGRDRLMLAA